MIVGIDAKELTKPRLESLGYILTSLLINMSEYRIVLFSDIPVQDKYMPKNSRNIIRGMEYKQGADLAKYQWWMSRQAKKHGVDVLFQINHFTLFPIDDVKQITVVHDLYPLEKVEQHSISIKLKYRLCLLLTLFNSSVIFTVSEFSKTRLEHFFWKSSKIKVNYNGIEQPLVEAVQCPIDYDYILMLGRVCYWKGTLRVAELYRKYLSDSGYKLVIAGKADDEKSAEQLREICNQCSNVIWLDYVSNEVREALMQNCSLFLYASRYDGFGLPPLELALRGKKVLMQNTEVLQEVTRGKGVYVDFYGDDATVVKCIRCALENENSQQIEDLRKIAQGYTWQKNTDTLKKTIADICKKV